jgi:hypothetical protein
MKQRFFVPLLLTVIYLSSCQKDSITPDIKNETTLKTTVSANALKQDSSAIDSIKGYLRIQLADYSVNTDNILIDFNPTAKTTYVKNEDAPTFQGFGLVSLSSLSSDNIALAINTVPLYEKGLTIKLKVDAKQNGTYKLNLTAINSVPDKFQIWLMDKYKKDSLDFRHNPTYAFDLIESDTSSYGSRRFSIVLR